MITQSIKAHDTAAVLGFGRSGRAAARFLADQGLQVSVYESRLPPKEALAPYLARGVRFFEGSFPPFFEESLLVRSPVIRPDIGPITASLERGATLSDEASLFLSHTHARLIGVTGSDGKTTTSALIAEMLRASGKRVFLGGNNGAPLLLRAGEMAPDDFAVLELSSFQLMTLEPALEVAVITNLTPNHLDWHRDMAEYAAAKARLLKHAGRAVLRADLLQALGLDERSLPPTTFFGEPAAQPPLRNVDTRVFRRGDALVLSGAGGEREIPCLGEFRLPGKHNIENLSAALAAVHPVASRQAVLDAARSFGGVPHRLQFVARVGGVEFYNSSIDTSPTRTAAALEALGRQPLVIAGGRGKGISLKPLGDTLATHARAVFAYGEARAEIAEAIGGRVPCESFAFFADAFARAAGAAKNGDTVLLSPGCTAFGEFKDFEERGECFCRLVSALGKEEKLGTERIDPRTGGADEHHRL